MGIVLNTCHPCRSSDWAAVESEDLSRIPYQPQYSLEKQTACAVSIIEQDHFTDINAGSFSLDTVQRNKDGWKIFYPNQPSLHSNITDLAEGPKLSTRGHAYTRSTPFQAHQHKNDQHFTIAVSNKIPSVVAWPDSRTTIDNTRRDNTSMLECSRSLLLGSMNPEPAPSHTMSCQTCGGKISSPPMFSISSQIPLTTVEPIFGSIDRSTTCVEYEVPYSNYTALPYVLDISSPFVNVSVEAVDPGLCQSSPVFRNIEPNGCSSTMLSISNPTVFISIDQEPYITNSSFEIGDGVVQNYFMELPMGNNISTEPTWISFEPVKASLESLTVIGNAVGRTTNTECPTKLDISSKVLVSFNPELIQLSPAFDHFEAQHMNNPQLSISAALPLVSVWPDSDLHDLPSGFLSPQKTLASPPIVSYIHFQEESSSDPIDFLDKNGKVPLMGARTSDGLRPRLRSCSTSSVIQFGSAALSPEKVLGFNHESSSNPLTFEES